MNATASKMVEDLIAAQLEMPVLDKNAKNPHFGSRFADLAETMKVKAVLNKHGFFVTQPTICHPDGRITIRTVFMHTSGGTVEGEWPVQPARPNDPQSMGSAVTYARRYSLQSLAGLVADDDDDGNAASPPPARGPATRAERRPMPMPARRPPAGEAAPAPAPAAPASRHTAIKGTPLSQEKVAVLNAALRPLRLGVAEAANYYEAAEMATTKAEAAEARQTAETIERNAKLGWIGGHLGRRVESSKDVYDHEFHGLMKHAEGGIFPK